MAPSMRGSSRSEDYSARGWAFGGRSSTLLERAFRPIGQRSPSGVDHPPSPAGALPTATVSTLTDWDAMKTRLRAEGLRPAARPFWVVIRPCGLKPIRT